MRVPLHFLGEDVAPGVVLEGGMVEHMLSDVEVKCKVDHIPEFIPVDLSTLALNESVHLSDLKLPKGVDLVDLAHGRDQTVAAIHPPQRAEEVVAEVAAEAEGAAEGAAPAEGAPPAEAKD
jgi:large subunit ribosomal protein L25